MYPDKGGGGGGGEDKIRPSTASGTMCGMLEPVASGLAITRAPDRSMQMMSPRKGEIDGVSSSGCEI